MNKIKIILALILWISYINLYNIYVSPSNYISDSSLLSPNTQKVFMNLNNWLLGIITMISVLAIIGGGAGYIYYSYSNNKEKEQMFKKVLNYSLIVLFLAGLTYSLTVSVIVGPRF